MKKVCSIVLGLVAFCLTLTGCESGNLLRTASFADITMAGSKDYTVKITFAEDERVDNRYYDVQIRCDGEKVVSIGKEFEEKQEVALTEDWQSLTTLLLSEPATETFVKGSEAVTVVYILNATENTKVTMRVVVGGVEENSTGTGQIITSPEECSGEFVLQMD